MVLSIDTHLPDFGVENKVPLDFLYFQDTCMCCVGFIENTLFKSLSNFADHPCLLTSR